jgi:hypothetical protein
LNNEYNPEILAKRAIDSYYLRLGVKPTDEFLIHLFRGCAKLIFKALDSLDEEEHAELSLILRGEGAILEPSLVEGAYYSNECHATLSELVKEKPVPLLEILAVQQDLELLVRPNLLRIAWIASRATGAAKSYMRSQVHPHKGRYIANSIGYAIDEIQKWTDKKADNVLDREEIESFRDLLHSITSDEDFPVSPDSLRNWIAHRDFVIEENRITFNLNDGKEKRLQFYWNAIDQMRDTTFRLSFLLLYLNSMFFLHASAMHMGLYGSSGAMKGLFDAGKLSKEK